MLQNWLHVGIEFLNWNAIYYSANCICVLEFLPIPSILPRGRPRHFGPII